MKRSSLSWSSEQLQNLQHRDNESCLGVVEIKINMTKAMVINKQSANTLANIQIGEIYLEQAKNLK